MQMIRRLSTALLLATALFATAAHAQQAPDALVKSVSQDVLDTARSDPKVQAGDAACIREVVEAKLAPHFDFTHMTMLAMGRNWQKASPAQQAELTTQFKTLLVHTYAGALSKYRDEKIEYKPLAPNPSATDVTVKTQVIKSGGGAPVPIDYSLAKTADGWKAYDIIVGGVSLVTNYRDEFNEQIRNGSVDGLIKTLKAKNG